MKKKVAPLPAKTKLTLNQRRQLWISALRTWIIAPVVLILVAYAMPFYVFDEAGISEHKYGSVNPIPWSDVSFVKISLNDSVGEASKAERNPDAELKFTLHTQGDEIDLNYFGMLRVNPELARRTLKIIRGKKVSIRCEIEPVTLKGLQAHKSADDTDAKLSKKGIFSEIQDVCTTQPDLNQSS